MPLVTVVITAFNAASFISQTLDSVLAQDFEDIEVLVIDGGSTDGTVGIVSAYLAPVRLIVGGRLTKSAGRNVGIAAAKGEYIAFVDADDLWLPHKLSRQAEYLENTPHVHWVYSDCFILDDCSGQTSSTWSSRTRLQAGRIMEPLLLDCFIPSPTPMIRRSVFSKVGVFDESFLRHEPEDWDMWLRIAARFSAGLINEPLAVLRVHPASLTAREDLRLTADGALAVVKRALDRNPSVSAGRGKEALAKWHLSFGRGLAALGRSSDARTLLARAIRANPAQASAYLLWACTWCGDKMLRRLKIVYDQSFGRWVSRAKPRFLPL
jgi:glycosyltransferase involved in cell wall biosynthesis